MVTTGIPAGIPEARKSETLTFRYNDLESAERLFADNPGEICCVLLEAERTAAPADGFLHKLRDLAHANGALFIVDEMVTGFRWDIGGAQEVYDIDPDLVDLRQGAGQRLPAVCPGRQAGDHGTGRPDQRAGTGLPALDHPRRRVGFARCRSRGHGLLQAPRGAGATATAGERLRAGVLATVAELGLEDNFTIDGRGCSMLYGTRDADKKPSQPFRTLFLQQTLRRALLAPNFIVSYSHTDADIDRTVEAVSEALVVYRRRSTGVEHHLEGRPSSPSTAGSTETRRPRSDDCEENEMKVVLFCGGLGTRLREHSETIPKPLVGGRSAADPVAPDAVLRALRAQGFHPLSRISAAT